MRVREWERARQTLEVAVSGFSRSRGSAPRRYSIPDRMVQITATSINASEMSSKY